LAWGLWASNSVDDFWSSVLQLSQEIRLRDCTGKDWKTKYPTSTNDEVREYLNTFVEAFAFDRKHNLKF